MNLSLLQMFARTAHTGTKWRLQGGGIIVPIGSIHVTEWGLCSLSSTVDVDPPACAGHTQYKPMP